jgi:N-acyl-D-amino-acid deacylase
VDGRREPPERLLDQALVCVGQGPLLAPVAGVAEEVEGRARTRRSAASPPNNNQDLGAVAQMLTNPDAVVGVADAGAHVALTMDAGQTTYLLRHWVRDEGLLDVGRAVRKLTLEGADLYGIPDRGVLAPGAHADVNVIDLAALDLDAPEMATDLPLGASRFVQRGRGYDCTMVNGRVLVDHDELTDERPGAVVSPG